MSYYSQTMIFTCFLALTVTTVHAEVTLDGTLGKSGALPGPDYQIGADVGQQHGGNLFHSFQDFNLQSHESATFSGPANVQNVISRVTGGNPSSIDGTIRSTIPNADLYFLNPYGIMFGPNAKLDVQGGFHASTADYLRLQDGGRFEARTPGNSLLTVAPVAAFGFLTDAPATITTQDTTLTVPLFKPLSLIGGNLHLQGSFPVQFDDQNIYAMFATSLLKTTGGPLYLAAVGSAGEVLVDNLDFTLTGQGGEIRLDRTLVDTSGPGSGHLKVRGRWLFMSDSALQANTLGDFEGGIMDIQLTESLQATSEPYAFLAFNNRSLGLGQSGSVILKAPEVIFSRVSLVNDTMTEANGGPTDLEVTRLTLREGASISNAPFGGKSGAITIKATESILITGKTAFGSKLINGVLYSDIPSSIDSTAYPKALEGGHINLITSRLDLVGGIVTSATLGAGSAGNIFVQAENINITEGGFIATSALGPGLAGNIRLNVTDTLFLSGRREGTYIAPVTGTQFDHNQSGIASFSLFGAGGQVDVIAKNIQMTEEAAMTTSSLGPVKQNTGGNLNLKAENFHLTQGAQINSSNGGMFGTTFFLGNGKGGEIYIQAKQLTLDGQGQHQQQTGILSDTYGQSQDSLGGTLNIEADSLDLTHGAAISARSYYVGDAGSIYLNTPYLHLAQHSSISTAATQAGGGNIDLLGLSDLLYLDESEITTSVTSGQGSGGNITIARPQFVVLNQGLIRAQADEGRGGNIRIIAEQFIPSVDSLVSASSRLGIDGEVEISAPDPNLGNKLFLGALKRTDLSSQLKRPCGGAKTWDEIVNPRFKFYVYPLMGSRQVVEDWGPSPLPPLTTTKSPVTGTAGKPTATSGRGKQAVAKGERKEETSAYQPVMLLVECPKEEEVRQHVD